MFQCSPKDPELYALRLFLLRISGARSYDDLKTVDNVTKGSFAEAAKARGLMQNVDEIDQILEEYLNSTDSLNKQCELFALILVWHEVGDARELWEKNWRQIVAKDKGYREAKTEAERAANTPKATEAAAAYESIAAKVHNNALRLVEDTLEHFRLNAASYMLTFVDAKDELAKAKGEVGFLKNKVRCLEVELE